MKLFVTKDQAFVKARSHDHDNLINQNTMQEFYTFVNTSILDT